MVFTTQIMVEDLIYLTFVNAQNLHYPCIFCKYTKIYRQVVEMYQYLIDFHDLSVCFCDFILIWMSFHSPFRIIIRAFQQQ